MAYHSRHGYYGYYGYYGHSILYTGRLPRNWDFTESTTLMI